MVSGWESSPPESTRAAPRCLLGKPVVFSHSAEQGRPLLSVVNLTARHELTAIHVLIMISVFLLTYKTCNVITDKRVQTCVAIKINPIVKIRELFASFSDSKPRSAS